MAYFLFKCFFGTLVCCFTLGTIALYVINYGNYEVEQLVLHFLFICSGVLTGIVILTRYLQKIIDIYLDCFFKILRARIK